VRERIAFGVSVFPVPDRAPVLDFIAPDEIPVVGPADHVVGDVIDKIFLRRFFPDLQGAWPDWALSTYSRTNFSNSRVQYLATLLTPACRRAQASVLVVGDQRFADPAAAVYRRRESAACVFWISSARPDSGSII
jgi:hypothetical protein